MVQYKKIRQESGRRGVCRGKEWDGSRKPSKEKGEWEMGRAKRERVKWEEGKGRGGKAVEA